MSRKELREIIEDLTTCHVQVKGRYFAPGEPNPGNERMLYVEIRGPNLAAITAAKKHVKETMENNAIRTLNLGHYQNIFGGGVGRRWDPRTGTMQG